MRLYSARNATFVAICSHISSCFNLQHARGDFSSQNLQNSQNNFGVLVFRVITIVTVKLGSWNHDTERNWCPCSDYGLNKQDVSVTMIIVKLSVDTG